MKKLGFQRVEGKTTARTAVQPARKRTAGASRSQDQALLGVRKRGKGFHVEIRTRGKLKIHVAHFGQDRELARAAHDAARLCHSGEVAYLALPEDKLNYWERRCDLATLFRGDARMIKLADEHRRKDEAGQNWDKDMKARLRELASDALNLIKAKAQEEAAAPLQSAAVDSQNNNGNVSLSSLGDEESPFDIDAALGPEDGAAPQNWPHTKESQRSLTPELPELSLQDQVDGLWEEVFRLEAEIRTLKAKLAGQDFPGAMLCKYTYAGLIESIGY